MRVSLLCASLALILQTSYAEETRLEKQVLGNLRLMTSKYEDKIVATVFDEGSAKSAPILRVEKLISEAPFAEFKLIDIENDGTPELEITGICDKSCEHSIYKYSNRKLQLVFEGFYSAITVIGEHYLVSEAGCCGEEVKVFSKPIKRQSKPLFILTRSPSATGEKCMSKPAELSAEGAHIAKSICPSWVNDEPSR